MSSRVLKKLQGPTDLEALKDSLLSDEDDDDEDIGRNAKGQNFNPFDLLNQQSLSESEVKEDDNETENASAAANVPASSISKKKKKKRKKKGTGKNASNCISSEDNEQLTEKHKVKAHNAISGNRPAVEAASAKATTNNSPDTPSITEQLKQYNSLLQVELRHLNFQNEIRRTFGKRVVKTETKRGRQKWNLKSAHLVNVKDTWPPYPKNLLSMKMVAAPKQLCNERGLAELGVSWFEFEHSSYYQKVQRMFTSSLESTDTELLVSLARANPYHIDSLLQLSDLCKMSEDWPLASELVQRAVASMELALHNNFSLTSGYSYLDYTRMENRGFFVTLFRHAQYLESRACSRTALEVSKLILNLNPIADPLAMVLVIDYYALRCHQFEWLVQFYEKLDPYRNLQQLPNMAYSYAFAMYHLKGECDESNNALLYALLMFPGVLLPLLTELSQTFDRRIHSCDYFKCEISGNQSPALHQLVCLYICRARVVWRVPKMMSWLEAMATLVVNKYEAGDPVFADYKAKRDARYVKPPREILRHVILSDFKEKVPLSQFLAKTDTVILAYDPLPPVDSVSCYDLKPYQRDPANPMMNNSVSMFFQSLLPNFLAPGIPENPQQQMQPPGVAAVQQMPLAPQAVAPEDEAGAAAVEIDRVAQVIENANANPDPDPNAINIVVDGPVLHNHDRAHPFDDQVLRAGLDLQRLNLNIANLQNVADADDRATLMDRYETSAAANSFNDLQQSFTNIVEAMRDFLHNFHLQATNTEDGPSDDEDDEDVDDDTDERQ